MITKYNLIGTYIITNKYLLWSVVGKTRWGVFVLVLFGAILCKFNMRMSLAEVIHTQTFLLISQIQIITSLSFILFYFFERREGGWRGGRITFQRGRKKNYFIIGAFLTKHITSAVSHWSVSNYICERTVHSFSFMIQLNFNEI